jgi:hypothetical protein
MRSVPATNDSEVYANVERSIGLTNQSNEGPFQPLEYFRQKTIQMDTTATRVSDSQYLLNSGFPNLAIGDSENDTNILGHENLDFADTSTGGHPDDGGSADTTQFCAAVDDGPRNRVDQRLDGPVVVPLPAELGNAHQIVELIDNGNFQDADNNLTDAAREAIRAAVTNTSFFQTYEARAQQVQDHVNSSGTSGIMLSIDRDRANENTLRGSQPSIVLRIPDLNRPKDRNRDAVHRIPINR